jgi:uncharacterized RDD family membrane protein YckC
VTIAADRPGRRGQPSAHVGEVLDADAVDVAATEPSLSYVGLVTRTIAFTVDAAIITAVSLVTTAAATLILSVISLPEHVAAAAAVAGGALYLLFTAGYFIVFWSTTGQTPGNRLMRIRVRPAGGERRLKPRRALVRFIGLTLAALPLFAGYLMILFDDRRRGLQDRLARTVVVDAPPVVTANAARGRERGAALTRGDEGGGRGPGG